MGSSRVPWPSPPSRSRPSSDSSGQSCVSWASSVLFRPDRVLDIRREHLYPLLRKRIGGVHSRVDVPLLEIVLLPVFMVKEMEVGPLRSLFQDGPEFLKLL